MLSLPICLLNLMYGVTTGFGLCYFGQHQHHQTVFPRPTSSSSSSLNLIPLSTFRNELSFFSTDKDQHRCCIDQDGKLILENKAEDENNSTEEEFEICIIEEEDLAEVTLFIVKAFGADVISMSNDLNEIEKLLMKPILGYANSYSALSAYAEVLWGLRTRQKHRIFNQDGKTAKQKEHINIEPPSLEGLDHQKQIEAASRGSLVLALARKGSANESKWVSVDSNIDVIASVELNLQVRHKYEISTSLHKALTYNNLSDMLIKLFPFAFSHVMLKYHLLYLGGTK